MLSNSVSATKRLNTDTGSVVKTFKVGNTRIKICDDYCSGMTPEAVQTTLNKIALRVQEQLAMQNALN